MEVLTKVEMRSLGEHDVDQGFMRDSSSHSALFLKETSKLRNQIENGQAVSVPSKRRNYMNDMLSGLNIEPRLRQLTFQKFRELWAAENGEQVYLPSNRGGRDAERR